MTQSKKLLIVLFSSLLLLCAQSQDDEEDVELNEEQTRAYRGSPSVDDVIKIDPLGNKYKWPKTSEKPYHIIVPVQIRESDYTKENLANFWASMYDIQNKTCVRIVKRIPAKHKNFIFVFDSGDNKCSSQLGKRGGQQPLKLTNGCMAIRKKCVHEMLHALGFHHMHQRYDRDNAITIVEENIKDPKVNTQWFRKFTNKWEAYGTPYDVFSVMHYDQYSFSKAKNLRTIRTKNPKYQETIGTWNVLSKGDARRINLMYKCPGQYLN